MPSPLYVSQRVFPLDDDITLCQQPTCNISPTRMTRLFQASGYPLEALQGSRTGSSPGYAQSRVCRYVVHAQTGGTLERHR